MLGANLGLLSYGEVSVMFSWNNHVKMLQDKAFKHLGALRRHKFSLDRRSLSKLYITFIRPMFEHGDIIWDSCSLENKCNLKNIQLDAARAYLQEPQNYVAHKTFIMVLA